MIFFAYFLMTLPVFCMITITICCIVGYVEAYGTKQDAKSLILEYAKYGLMISVGVSAFIGGLFWLFKVWAPSVELFFGI